jgi:glycosyltransferase involved in cell wall biosynthesis
VEVVKDGETGFLVAEKDPKAIANAVEKYIKEPESLLRHSENAKKHVLNNFSPKKILSNVISCYERLL